MIDVGESVKGVREALEGLRAEFALNREEFALNREEFALNRKEHALNREEIVRNREEAKNGREVTRALIADIGAMREESRRHNDAVVGALTDLAAEIRGWGRGGAAPAS